ncbi:MAG: cytochrome c [Trueperaceae bacterium]|nr:cytochrome c [Trueperaceae bacterium]
MQANSSRWFTRTLVLLALLLAASGAWAKAAYFIQADVVRGAVGAMGAVCVANAVFIPGEQMVWRAYVYDSDSGDLLTQEQIDAKGIKVYGELDSGVKVALNYIPHPPESPNTELFWAAGWQIPRDYATGTYQWSVVVEDAAGNTATYMPMGHSVGLGAINIVAPPAAAAGGGGPALATVADTAPDGEQLFVTNCSACHQANGVGISGTFPPLAGNPIITADDPTFITRVVLYGLQGKITVAGTDYDGVMPPWQNVFDDAQIAAILSYVRSTWGNSAAAVDAAAVAAQRAVPGSADDNYAKYPH